MISGARGQIPLKDDGLTIDGRSAAERLPQRLGEGGEVALDAKEDGHGAAATLGGGLGLAQGAPSLAAGGTCRFVVLSTRRKGK